MLRSSLKEKARIYLKKYFLSFEGGDILPENNHKPPQYYKTFKKERDIKLILH